MEKRKDTDILLMFSGEDVDIIKSSDEKTRRFFKFVGFWVLIICLGSFISAFAFMYNVYEKQISISLFFGLFWGGLMAVLYLLFLYTFTPSLHSFKSDKKKGEKSKRIMSEQSTKDYGKRRGYLVSLAFRAVFMSVLAIIVAQPVNKMFFGDKVHLCSEESECGYVDGMRRLMTGTPPKCNSDKYQEARVQTFWAYVHTAGVCVIFLLPIYWKRRIRTGDFYKIKTEYERGVVEKDYQAFKEHYSLSLSKYVNDSNAKILKRLNTAISTYEVINTQMANELRMQIAEDLKEVKLEKYEIWVDHPFRTMKKDQSRILLPQNTLLNDIYKSE